MTGKWAVLLDILLSSTHLALSGNPRQLEHSEPVRGDEAGREGLLLQTTQMGFFNFGCFVECVVEPSVMSKR